MWSDTDPAGIVWFGVFFRYFENAEEDLYRRLGSDRTRLLSQLNVFMPRTSLQSGFRSPAKLGDDLLVLSTVQQVRAASVVIHQRVMRGSELLADARVTAAFLDHRDRPKRQPREWVEKFNAISED